MKNYVATTLLSLVLVGCVDFYGTGDSNSDTTFLTEHGSVSWCTQLDAMAPNAALRFHCQPPFSVAGAAVTEGQNPTNYLDVMLDAVFAVTGQQAVEVVFIALGTTDYDPNPESRPTVEAVVDEIEAQIAARPGPAYYVATVPPIYIDYFEDNNIPVAPGTIVALQAAQAWYDDLNAEVRGRFPATQLIEFADVPANGTNYFDIIHLTTEGQRQRALKACATLGWSCE